MKIISGYLKHRKIIIKSKSPVRPTLNIVREAVFDYLSDQMENKTFLDLFAGTGSISFEAISRGIKHITLTEIDKDLYRELKNNFELLNIRQDKYFLKNWNSLIFLKRTKKTFDYIYIDPPYKFEELYKNVLNLIINKKLLNPDGLIILERHKRNKVLENNDFPLINSGERKYGSTLINFLKLR